MNTNAILAIVAGTVLVAASFAFLGSSGMLGTSSAEATTIEQPWFPPTQLAGQVDLKGTYNNLFDDGFFKLLIDTTPTPVIFGHVAISNVRCNDDGESVFALIVANALTGPGTTQFDVVALDSSNLVNDVSDLGDKCTYHVDINAGYYTFPITDLAVANTHDDDSKSISDVGSATYNLFVGSQNNVVHD
jgi:hypothetical protein